ncbi:MAG: trypsin-like serine protease [Ruminococcaceae bacterium]|nr:trypsin-like serine protease [Oscillospiraceae bacterium]
MNMNDQNSQFENPYFDYTREGGQTPNYSLTKRQLRKQRRQQRRSRRSQRGLSFLGVLLCVVLSFAAGFGGSVGAMYLAGFYLFSEEEITTTQDVLCEDPESVLSRPESDPSIYGSAGEDAFAISGVVSKVQDSVVVIDVLITGTSVLGRPTTQTGSGSGVIISADGYVLTCHHVIDGATSVKVTLRNNNTYDAVLVGSDAASDLAVLKIAAKEELTYAAQGHSADLIAGEQVVAIGNPLGTLGGTVTVGYISATEREITMSDGSKMTLLQTDTAINSGNSGGGLFNLAGELIGIVNSKYSASGVEGLAFAIPIDSAYPVQLDLMQYGYVRGVTDHGLTLLDITQANLAQYYYLYGIEEIGVYVVESKYTTELKNKDRIVSLNGTEIETTADIGELLDECKVGDVITIVAERDGESITCSLTLQEYVPDRIKDYLQ